MLQINLVNTDLVKVEKMIMANFGYLLSNTVNKYFEKNFILNMKYLTSYLVLRNMLTKEDLYNIVYKELYSNSSINSSFGENTIYSNSNLLINVKYLYRVSNIISNLNNIFFFNHSKRVNFLLNFFNKNRLFKNIYKEFFDYVKELYQIDYQVYDMVQLNCIFDEIVEASINIEYSNDEAY